MSVSLMNLEEIISSAKNKTYTKKITCVSVLGLAVCAFSLILTANLDVPLFFKTIIAILTVLGLVSIVWAFAKWGEKCSLEQFALKNKIPNMTIGELKKFYKTYGTAPRSAKRVDEKILMEQIMIDIALHFKNQGAFIEPLKDFIEKGLKHKTSNVYTFVAMTEHPKLDDRVNIYILDTFFSTNFLDDVLLESIKFKEDRVNMYVLG